LQSTLEKRLGDSFKLVSERLEAVQRGLGEMQGLANGVGDLKRVLTNVKTRGTWGEFQLGSILDQVLAPSQYQQNVQTREDSRDVVEYAVKLPGKDDGADSQIWLPIDSKFPQEDYQRLLDAVDASDVDLVEKTGAALMRTIRIEAQRIHDKYLNPPKTTDFAIMFLPTEGLYAEVLRKPDVVEDMQRKYRIVVAGPTTLAAILSSLRMGFHTLAIEKRASEVWKILAAVKTEFGKFGDVLERVKRQLAAATNTIEETGKRTRVMEKRLKDVEQLPAAEATQLLGTDAAESEVPEADEPDPENPSGIS
jgi:DNA recombination protein RmuC